MSEAKPNKQPDTNPNPSPKPQPPSREPQPSSPEQNPSTPDPRIKVPRGIRTRVVEGFEGGKSTEEEKGVDSSEAVAE